MDKNKLGIKKRENKLSTLEKLINNIISYEEYCFEQKMKSFIGEHKVIDVAAYMAVYKMIDVYSANCVENLYNKMQTFPFRSLAEIKEVEEAAYKCYIGCFQIYPQFIPTTQEINEELLTRKNKLAETEIYLGDAILKDKLKDKKERYKPVIYSGIWGVIGSIAGSLLGAAIGAWVALYTSGMTTWPFK